MSLTDRQRKELNLAIYDYLISQGGKHSESAALFLQETGLNQDENNLTKDSLGRGLLEKKWTAVVRLQKKIMELEAKIELQTQQLTALNNNSLAMDVSTTNSSTTSKSSRNTLLLPRAPYRNQLIGHRDSINCLAVHPQYSLLASGGDEGVIRIWDIDTNTQEKVLKGHTGAITSLAFAPHYFNSPSFNHIASVNTSTSNPSNPPTPSGSGGNPMNFSSTSPLTPTQLLASCSIDLSAKLWCLQTYTCLKTLKGHDHSLSGILFASSSLAAYSQAMLSGRGSMNFSKLNNQHAVDEVFTSSRDGTIKCWQINTGYCIRTISINETNTQDDIYWIRAISLSEDGLTLSAGGNDFSIRVFNARNGNLEQILRGHEHVVESVAYCRGSDSTHSSWSSFQDTVSSPFSLLVSGSRDRTVRVWDSLKGVCLHVFNDHENWVRSVAFAFNSCRFILSTSDDKSLRVFDLKDKRCYRTISDAHNHFVTSIAMNQVNPCVVTASVDRTINIWSCF